MGEGKVMTTGTAARSASRDESSRDDRCQIDKVSTEESDCSSCQFSSQSEQPIEDWGWHRLIQGRYDVRGVDVLGIGSFSVVRRAVDTSSGKPVALKCLKRHREGKSKFNRELSIFSAVFSEVPRTGDQDRPLDASPRWRTDADPEDEQQCCSEQLSLLPRPEKMFVQLLAHSELGAFNDDCFTVLELGSFTLEELVLHCSDAARLGERHSLEGEMEMLRVLSHVSRALLYLHSRMFLHGDIKPSNIMWFGDVLGTWKLIDLDGLRTSGEVLDMCDADFYTTPYAAPELARAVAAGVPLRLSRRLDIWAAGASILEMELLAPPLLPKVQEFCGEEGDLQRFMEWLAETPDPMPFPSQPRAVSAELLRVLQEDMLVRDPRLRSSPSKLLALPLLADASWSSVPPSSLRQEPLSAPLSAPAKPRTAWQCFVESHSPPMREAGLTGLKLLRELHAQWKILQAEGGEELEALRRWEQAALRAVTQASQSAKSEMRCSQTARVTQD